MSTPEPFNWNAYALRCEVDAEIRSKRGERQVRCRECNKWQWPRTPAQEQTGENE